MDYSCIFFFFFATIIVTVKLVLEQQRDSDRKNGIEQIASSYTIKGMIHLIRNERKRKKNIRKLHLPQKNAETDTLIENKTKLSVKQFNK